jgi:tRNA threonylcarbamoyladenosine biosynthesis protein TsaB
MSDMMILAVDSATRWTGLALYDGKRVVAEHGWRSVNTHTVEMAQMLMSMLRRAAIEAADLTGIVVALGPGSYTGLRVGLGLAKGLSLAHRIPLVGVPTLDIVVAAQPELEGRLFAVAEAGRKRITVAAYDWQGKQGWITDEGPFNTTWETLLAELEPPASFTGEVAPQARKQIRAKGRGFAVLSPAQRARRAGFLAQLGWERLRRGDSDDAAALTPLYLTEP